MKEDIKERRELLMKLMDEYTRGVCVFASHQYGKDYAGYDIDVSEGASRYQLHEMAKMLRREILKLDKAIMVRKREGYAGLGR